MRIIHGLECVDRWEGRPVLSIGNFDGVHLAHQRIIARAQALARSHGTKVVVLTFEPHPLTVVAPARVPELLTPLEAKLRHLSEAGAEVTVVARSEPGLLEMEAEEFVEKVIQRRFDPLHIVEGPTFGFGRGRKGTPELLREWASRFGCTVHVVEPVTMTGASGETTVVSSSLIRQYLREGRVTEAARGLGRPFALYGRVVRGVGRGRTLGFPTANVMPVSSQLIPGDGVFAGRASVADTTHECAISIGTTPTFGGHDRRVEAHLLDFDGDVYDQPIILNFTRFLRPQHRFDSSDALRRQLTQDVQAARSQAE